MTIRARDKGKFGISIKFNHTGALRRRLISEITDLERQMNALKVQGGAADFALMAAYKELINSRKSLLRQLPNSWCW